MFKKLLNVKNLNDLREVVNEEINNSKMAKNQFHLIYEAGLPDMKGPKNVNLTFKEGELTLSAGFLTRIVFKPEDILEVDIHVQDVDQTANAMQGARIGKLLGGKLGEIGGAALSSKQRKEDTLHLVVNYKGQARAIFFQQNRDFQILCIKLKEFSKK